MDALRAIDVSVNCLALTNTSCQIPFVPKESIFDRPSPVGVMLYGGALVDTRT
jgi:hypothetical protein